jgi:CHAD domain-containing protein
MPEERDGMLESGMERGMNETYARLDELLARLAMSRCYRLQEDEEVGAAVRRIAHGRVDAALDQLGRDAGTDVAQAIHDTRKDMKKLRSLLRLVRDGLGERRYRAENGRYRDAARQLSGPRDAEVDLATLAGLRERYPDEAPPAETLQRALEREHERLAADGAALDERIERAADAIAAGGIEIDDWPLDGDGFELVRVGLERAYRRGRRGLRAAHADPTDEAVHEWRKRAKDLWYHLRLLHDAWPTALEAAADEAHELSDLLGDHHDLAVLATDARRLAPDDPDAEGIATLAKRRQAELLDIALPLGDRLYAEKPGQFTRRLESYWRIWRRLGG